VARGRGTEKAALRPSECYAEAWTYGRELGPFLSKCIEFLGQSGGGFEGDARPLLRNVKLTWRTAREGALKYVEKDDGTRALFNVENDPFERVDLSRYAPLANTGLARALTPAFDLGALKRLAKRLEAAARFKPKRAKTAAKAARRGRAGTQAAALEKSLKHLGYLE
jgi:hypothetical protein